MIYNCLYMCRNYYSKNNLFIVNYYNRNHYYNGDKCIRKC